MDSALLPSSSKSVGGHRKLSLLKCAPFIDSEPVFIYLPPYFGAPVLGTIVLVPFVMMRLRARPPGPPQPHPSNVPWFLLGGCSADSCSPISGHLYDMCPKRRVWYIHFQLWNIHLTILRAKPNIFGGAQACPPSASKQAFCPPMSLPYDTHHYASCPPACHFSDPGPFLV